MPLETGRYFITNVKFSNLAILPDANDDSDLVGNAEADNDRDKWNITLLNNGKYSIKNHGFDRFVGCENRPGENAAVKGQDRSKQWAIKETRTKGQYTINPTDADSLYWGLVDAEDGTPLALSSKPTDPKNQWIFQKANA